MIAWLVRAIGTFIASAGASTAANIAAKGVVYTITRGFLISLMYVALPVVLYNTLADWALDLAKVGLNWLGVNFTFNDVIITMSGVGYWVAQQLQLGTCLQMVASAVGTRAVLIMLRFA